MNILTGELYTILKRRIESYGNDTSMGDKKNFSNLVLLYNQVEAMGHKLELLLNKSNGGEVCSEYYNLYHERLNTLSELDETFVFFAYRTKKALFYSQGV